jgi:hypothetical protein
MTRLPPAITRFHRQSRHVVLKGLEELLCFRQCQAEVRDPWAVLLEGRSFLVHVGLTTGIRADDALPLSFMRRPPSGWCRWRSLCSPEGEASPGL